MDWEGSEDHTFVAATPVMEKQNMLEVAHYCLILSPSNCSFSEFDFFLFFFLFVFVDCVHFSLMSNDCSDPTQAHHSVLIIGVFRNSCPDMPSEIGTELWAGFSCILKIIILYHILNGEIKHCLGRLLYHAESFHR